MTNLEYLRSKMRDLDTTDQILTDEELTEIIRKNSQVEIRSATKSSIDGLIYSTGLYRVDEAYEDKVIRLGNNEIIADAVFDKIYGSITFTTAPTSEVGVEAKVIYWSNVMADVFETIAADYRKLNSYTVVNAQQNLDDSKSFLLRMARYYRGAMGAEL